MEKVQVSIPRTTVRRLSLCYRLLAELEQAKSDEVVSSATLASMAGCTPELLRRDLALFGSFGVCGRGYRIAELKERIGRILGKDRPWNVALAGAGNLGTALLSYSGFREQGFRIIAAFDSDKRKLGKQVGGVIIKDISEMEEEIKALKIKIGIVATPAGSAQDVVDRMVGSGVQSVLNFAPVSVSVPDGVRVNMVDLSVEMDGLSQFLTSKEDRDRNAIRQE